MPTGKQWNFLILVIAGIIGAFLVFKFLLPLLVSIVGSLFSFLMFLSIFLVPIGLILMGSYNSMQSQAQGIKEAHSNTIVSMQKRVDLANKLVDIASSYGEHEKLTQITVAQNESVQAAMNTSQEIDGTVNRILSMARAYPDLKANQTYQNLMSQLESIENDLQQKRQAYNGRVRSYNTSCTSIPIVFVASYLGFKTAPYFDVANADSLENLKDFHSSDGENLKNALAQVTNKVVNKTQNPLTEIPSASQNLLTDVNENPTDR
jgi:LemA protein